MSSTPNPLRIHQLRSATLLLEVGEHRLLVDPMLADVGALPGFKVFGGGRRKNPIVALPPSAQACLDGATGVLVTHEHPDHFDPAAEAWTKSRALPVWTTGVDVASLRRRGLDARELVDGELGMRVEVIENRHGRGFIGWAMGPVSGFFLAPERAPSVYLTGDAVLTANVLDAMERLDPDVIVAPAGAANFGRGGDILFSVDEVIELARRARGELVLNHLEALDHCPTTRAELRARVEREGLSARVHVPEDGEVLAFHARERTRAVEPRRDPRRPGFQKWLTAKFA